MSNPVVIGPNGKDVYAVAMSFRLQDNGISTMSVLVEANSKEESIGLGWGLAEKVVKKEPSCYKKCELVVSSCVLLDLSCSFSIIRH